MSGFFSCAADRQFLFSDFRQVIILWIQVRRCGLFLLPIWFVWRLGVRPLICMWLGAKPYEARLLLRTSVTYWHNYFEPQPTAKSTAIVIQIFSLRHKNYRGSSCQFMYSMYSTVCMYVVPIPTSLNLYHRHVVQRPDWPVLLQVHQG